MFNNFLTHPHSSLASVKCSQRQGLPCDKSLSTVPLNYQNILKVQGATAFLQRVILALPCRCTHQGQEMNLLKLNQNKQWKTNKQQLKKNKKKKKPTFFRWLVKLTTISPWTREDGSGLMATVLKTWKMWRTLMRCCLLAKGAPKFLKLWLKLRPLNWLTTKTYSIQNVLLRISLFIFAEFFKKTFCHQKNPDNLKKKKRTGYALKRQHATPWEMDLGLSSVLHLYKWVSWAQVHFL